MVNYGNYGRIILIIAIVIVAIVAIITIVKKSANNSKKSSKYPSVPPEKGPYIAVKYIESGSLLDDGKCGWLDVECEDGSTETVELKFKKTSNSMFIPLKTAKYRITYRSKSKAAMAAKEVMSSINANNGAMGAFSNAVYEAGVGSSQLSSVVVDVDEKFVMKLACSTDGFTPHCEIVA